MKHENFCELFEHAIKHNKATGECPFAEICNGLKCINPDVKTLIVPSNIQVVTQEDISQEAFLLSLVAKGVRPLNQN